MIKIDGHNHPDFMGYDFDATIKNMDDADISKTLLLSCETPIKDAYLSYEDYLNMPDKEAMILSFSKCLEYYNKAPDRFILGYSPNPKDPLAKENLRRAKEDYNIKVCGEFKFRVNYDDPDVIEYFKECGRLNLPVFTHTDYEGANKSEGRLRESYWYGGDMENFEKALSLCPETIFFGHATCFWAHISNDDKWKTLSYPQGEVIRGGKVENLLEKYDNLYLDLSAGSALTAFSRDINYTKELLKNYQDRAIFGRDSLSNETSDFLDSLGLDNEIMEKLYHKNIERILNL